MRYLIILSVFLLSGCVREQAGVSIISGSLSAIINGMSSKDFIVTSTVQSVVFDEKRNPVGHFTMTQKRWAETPSAGSDISIEFQNTTQNTLSFNYVLTLQGTQFRDAIVSLKPGQTYSNQRKNLKYNALDRWTLMVDGRVSKTTE